jgi:hypothetical protein
MTRWRDPRLPKRWSDLAPSVAVHIPANRLLHAVDRMLESMQRTDDLVAELIDRSAAADRARRLRR